LPVTDDISLEWGRLNAGDPLPVVDGLLAATALVHRLTLVTRNVGDFARVDGVFAYTTASFEQALRIVESGKLDVRPLISHTLPMQEFARAFDLLCNRPEPVVKVMLRP
jgi:threonine dehydrogenase-like Zn-dependent dehydrogenase